MSHAARAAYEARCFRVARIIEEHARKSRKESIVDVAAEMSDAAWRNAFELAGVTFAGSMVADVMLALRSGGDRDRAHGPDSIESDSLIPPKFAAPVPTCAPESNAIGCNP